MSLLGLFTRVRSLLEIFCFAVLFTIVAQAISGSGGVMVLEDNFQNLTNWTSVNGNAPSFGLYALKEGGGSLIIDDNQFTDINTGIGTGIDVISVRAGGAFSTVTITDNDYDNPDSYTIDRYIECRFPSAYVSENTTSTTQPIYAGA